MTNKDHITDIERQLAEAKRAASPVIVEKTVDTKDEIVYVNKTSGTVRKDLLGGKAAQYHDSERPAPQPEVSICDKPVDPAIGKVVKTTDKDRTVKLVSGTKRTDLR